MNQIPWIIATALVIAVMMFYTIISIKITALITAFKPLTIN